MSIYPAKEDIRITEPYLEIRGGIPLRGEVRLPGAKNAALPAIVAACLSSEDVVLRNVPTELNDVQLLIRMLRDAGADIRASGTTLRCNGSGFRGGALSAQLAGKIRHSLLLLGLAANWRAPLFLPLPGGCAIGSRKHDMHVEALRRMGFSLAESELGLHLAEGGPAQTAEIEFHYPTFGGTLNVLFAAVRSEATVVLRGAARNPEVIDVIRLLEAMGARIEWRDERTLAIRGAARLSGAEHTVMSDRIVAATVIAAVGVTKGDAVIGGADASLLEAEIAAWRRAGLGIEALEGGIRARWECPLRAVDVTTAAYPGFHTDIQPLHAVLMATAAGESVLKETILDGRFAYCAELNKMGARIRVEDGGFRCVNGAPGQVARIRGVERLRGGVVRATDIRGGAAVAVAALGALGVTRVTNLYQLERGYGNFVELFSALGADIARVHA